MSAESPTNKTKKMPMLYHQLNMASSPIVQAFIELGIEDDKVTTKTMSAEELKEDDYLKLSATGECPVYTDDQGHVTCGSLPVMLRVLDDFDTEHKLMPAAGDHRRYECIEACCLVTKDEAEASAAIEAVLKRNDGLYVLGDQLSAADFFLAHYMMGKTFKDSETITAYVATMDALPSTRQVYQLDSAVESSDKAEDTEMAAKTGEGATEDTAANPAEEEEAEVAADTKGKKRGKTAADTKSLEIETVAEAETIVTA
jgi:glutathione S-transferase